MTGEKWDGEERRNDFNTTSLILYRMGKVEEKVEELDRNVDKLTIDFNVLKTELANMAKSEGKVSGLIYGVGGSIVMTVIALLIQKAMGM